ncbi:putative major facilitator superfamily transporter [Gordonia soli NBRC 108243]|uniref:Putative major facilitator superfamily transporter n=2 Tax=Gordonia soli TaxID=320799 RepID=M0QF56_9ACTN|nr:putative major facilitator superfamily transporter [Gordonia soli NBRC 108243]
MFGRVPTGGLGRMRTTVDDGLTAQQHTTTGQWLAVAALTFGTFLAVTSEMLPVGVLTPLAAGLHISPGAAGFSLTVAGLMSAVTAAGVSRVIGDADRRRVLACAMGVLAVGNVLTMVANGFTMLVISRLVLGVGMGAVWGMAAAVAARLVARRNVTLAVSIAVSGVASASVAGVPIGTAIGDAFGWRSAFGVLAALAGLAAIGILVALPVLRRPVAPRAGTAPAPRLPLLRASVTTGAIVIVALVTAHFAAYTYVRPVLEERTGMSAGVIAIVLLVYGVFGLVGNFVAGAVAGRRPRATLLTLAGGIAVAIAALTAFGTSTPGAIAAIALWGIAYGGVSVGGQLWMTAAAPDRIEHITGLYVGAFTASIALGALVGGLLVEGVGLLPLLWITAALAATALAAGLVGRSPANP